MARIKHIANLRVGQKVHYQPEHYRGKINMLAVGNDELDKAPPIGDFILCISCGRRHIIKYGNKVLPDGTLEPSKTLAFYKCGESLYLAGIDGKRI